VLRHTFATLYLQRRTHDSGALTKLQELLGHASLETTRGYLHHTRDELERSMRAPDRTVLDSAAAAGVLPGADKRAGGAATWRARPLPDHLRPTVRRLRGDGVIRGETGASTSASVGSGAAGPAPGPSSMKDR
jgi:hypothetical protein